MRISGAEKDSLVGFANDMFRYVQSFKHSRATQSAICNLQSAILQSIDVSCDHMSHVSSARHSVASEEHSSRIRTSVVLVY